MKKKDLVSKLRFKKNLVSNLQSTKLTGGNDTHICSGTQDTCINCQGPTREYPCPTARRCNMQ